MANAHVNQLWIPLGIAIASCIALFVIRKIALRHLAHWVIRYNLKSNTHLLGVFRVPSLCWVLALGLYVGIAASELQARYAQPMYQSIHIILILSVSFVFGNFAVLMVNSALQRNASQTVASGLSLAVVRGTFLLLGILASLSVLGISIAPLLTALGVGGLAVALALKDTLENFFAGIYLITDRTLRVGDYVKLENGQEGMVEDIGWRTSKVRTLSDTTVVLPNSKLAQSVITNYSLPDRRFCLSIPVSVSLDADVIEVEKILLSVTKAASEDVVGVLASPEPSVRLNPGFGEFSIDFTVNVTVSDFGAVSFARHELRKRYYKKFREMGVRGPLRRVELSGLNSLPV